MTAMMQRAVANVKGFMDEAGEIVHRRGCRVTDCDCGLWIAFNTLELKARIVNEREFEEVERDDA